MAVACRRVLFVLSLGASVATTKRLLVGVLMHYPLHVLCIHLAAAQLVQIYHSLRTASSRVEDFGTQFWPRHTGRENYHLRSLFEEYDVLMLVAIVLALPILLSAYEALAFASNLPSTVMVLTLDWRSSGLLRKVIVDRSLGLEDLLRYTTFVIGVVFILVCDFRLNAVQRDRSIAFLGYTGLAEICSNWKIIVAKSSSWRPTLVMRDVESNENDNGSHDLDHQQRLWSWIIPVALLTTGMLMFRTESLDGSYIHTRLLIIAGEVILNTMVTMVAFVSWTQIDLASSDDPSATYSRHQLQHHTSGAMLGLAIAGVASAVSTALVDQPAVISTWQYIGYGAALFAFTTMDEFRLISQMFAKTSSRKDLPARASSWLSTPRLMVLIALLSWSGYFYGQNHTKPTFLGEPVLDLSQPAVLHDATAKLDIVVARYDQPAATLAKDLTYLIHTGRLEYGEKTHIIVYDKHSDTEKDFRKEFMANMTMNDLSISIRTLENIGREGDTYLHHIVNSWDTLATHTLFMQDGIHNLQLTANYIHNFFIPETGFLSLSYEGNVCKDCGKTGAPCRQTEDPAMWSQSYSMANAGKSCQDLVLTFRGQFIVSAARIRGNNKKMYEGLLQWLRDPQSYVHSLEYTHSVWHRKQEDSMRNPVFGYTLERMWGALMQCSELRVGHYCPSQLAVYMRPRWLAGGFAHDDVQCLDRPVQSSH